MSGEPDWGKDEFPDAEELKLTAEEQKILDEFMADLKRAGAEFDKWLTSVSKKAPKRRIKFSVELEGEPLRKLMFLKHIMIEGYNVMPHEEFVRTVVRAGVESLYDAFVNSELAQAMKMLQVEQLPAPIRDAIVTVELKEFVKRLVSRVNKDGNLTEFMRVRTPVQKAPQSRGDYQKIMRPTNAQPAGVAPTEGESCAFCHKPLSNDTMEYDGKKFHSDCLIDYGLKMKDQAQDQENSPT